MKLATIRKVVKMGRFHLLGREDLPWLSSWGNAVSLLLCPTKRIAPGRGGKQPAAQRNFDSVGRAV
jgi:hypothetical protein